MAKKSFISKNLLCFFALFSVLIISLSSVPEINAVNEPYTLGAHRGSSVEHTENTLEAIKSALNDDRYHFIEFDVQYTKDKRIVVHHDKTLFRLQGKLVELNELTYAELNQVSNYQIPQYHEVMDLIGNKKKINLEIKSQGNFTEDQQLVDFVVADLKTRGVLKNTLFSSISGEVVNYIKERYPQQKTGKIYLVMPITYFPLDNFILDFYNDADKTGADYVMLHGINLRSFKPLLEHKPADKTLAFWYFDDQMYVMNTGKKDFVW